MKKIIVRQTCPRCEGRGVVDEWSWLQNAQAYSASDAFVTTTITCPKCKGMKEISTDMFVEV